MIGRAFVPASDLPREPVVGSIMLPCTTSARARQFMQESSAAWADDAGKRHEARELATTLARAPRTIDHHLHGVEDGLRARLRVARDQWTTLARHGEIENVLFYAGPIDFTVERYHALRVAARDVVYHPACEAMRRSFAEQAGALFYRVLEHPDRPFITHSNPMTTGIAEWAMEKALQNRIHEFFPAFDATKHVIRRALLHDWRDVDGEQVAVSRYPDLCVTGRVLLPRGWSDEVMLAVEVSLRRDLEYWMEKATSWERSQGRILNLIDNGHRSTATFIFGAASIDNFFQNNPGLVEWLDSIGTIVLDNGEVFVNGFTPLQALDARGKAWLAIRREQVMPVDMAAMIERFVQAARCEPRNSTLPFEVDGKVIHVTPGGVWWTGLDEQAIVDRLVECTRDENGLGLLHAHGPGYFNDDGARVRVDESTLERLPPGNVLATNLLAFSRHPGTITRALDEEGNPTYRLVRNKVITLVHARPVLPDLPPGLFLVRDGKRNHVFTPARMREMSRSIEAVMVAFAGTTRGELYFTTGDQVVDARRFVDFHAGLLEDMLEAPGVTVNVKQFLIDNEAHVDLDVACMGYTFTVRVSNHATSGRETWSIVTRDEMDPDARELETCYPDDARLERAIHERLASIRVAARNDLRERFLDAPFKSIGEALAARLETRVVETGDTMTLVAEIPGTAVFEFETSLADMTGALRINGEAACESFDARRGKSDTSHAGNRPGWSAFLNHWVTQAIAAVDAVRRADPGAPVTLAIARHATGTPEQRARATGVKVTAVMAGGPVLELVVPYLTDTVGKAVRRDIPLFLSTKSGTPIQLGTYNMENSQSMVHTITDIFGLGLRLRKVSDLTRKPLGLHFSTNGTAIMIESSSKAWRWGAKELRFEPTKSLSSKEGGLLMNMAGSCVELGTRIHCGAIAEMAQAMVSLVEMGVHPGHMMVKECRWTRGKSLFSVVEIPVVSLLGGKTCKEDVLQWLAGSGHKDYTPGKLRIVAQGRSFMVPGSGIGAVTTILEKISENTVVEGIPGRVIRDSPYCNKLIAGTIAGISTTDAGRILRGLDVYGVLIHPPPSVNGHRITLFVGLSTCDTAGGHGHVFVLNTCQPSTNARNVDFIVKFATVQEAILAADMLCTLREQTWLVVQKKAMLVKKKHPPTFGVLDVVKDSRMTTLNHHRKMVSFRVIPILWGIVHDAFWQSGVHEVPVKTPVAVQGTSTGAWSWMRDERGEVEKYDFVAWMDYYYQGVLPAGTSKTEALVIFVSGQFPRGNTISLDTGSWALLPPV